MTENELYQKIKEKGTKVLYLILNCMDCPFCGARCLGDISSCEENCKKFYEEYERTHLYD